MVPAGMIQFGDGRVPDLSSGTCLDDNARVWLVTMFALSADAAFPYAREAGDAAVGFVADAHRPDGLFHNFADASGRFVDQIGSEDSFGRAIWACGVAAGSAVVPQWRDAAIKALVTAQPAIGKLTARHALAYAILGLSAAIAPDAASPIEPGDDGLPGPLRDRLTRLLTGLADGLDDLFRSRATGEWPWWSDELTWGNARLPEAMLRASAATGDRRYLETGKRAFEFLAGITQPGDMFVPIGNDGWYARGGKRARYDQQPIEACAMADAWLAMYRLTHDSSDLRRAQTAFEWFNGRNSERIALGDPQTGGCYDGLLHGGVNPNQGAESTLSYLHADFAVNVLPALRPRIAPAT